MPEIEVLSKPAPTPVKTMPAPTSGKEFLFDSIAHEGIHTEDTVGVSSSWGAVFTGLMWVGYAIAIAVSLVLVWSAARELLR